MIVAGIRPWCQAGERETYTAKPLIAANLTEERTVEFHYTFTVDDIPEGATTASAWVPIPATNSNQALLGFEVSSGLPYEITTGEEYGNRFLHLDLSGVLAQGLTSVPVEVAFNVTRRAYRITPGENGGTIVDSGADLSRFLSPDSLVPIDGRIAEEAKTVSGDYDTPIDRARGIYDHIVGSVEYDKSGEGWGRGDALYACDVRAGNCTDFHSLFIGEVRSLEIPARFIMGFPLPPSLDSGEVPGYHCWAEFYIEGTGWLPVDASEARKHPELKEMFFGGLDANRIEFTIGRDIKIPGANSGAQNYVIYPYVEVDGSPHESVTSKFFFENDNGGMNPL